MATAEIAGIFKMRLPAILAAALAGCAATQATAPVMPAIADVTTAQSQLSAISDPQGFFRTAAAQILANCGGYFDQLVAIAQRNAQTSNQVTGASQALSAILGLAQAAPGPISLLGVVGPAVTGAIATAQMGMPGSDHPAEMSTIIAAEMNAYLAAIGNPPADAPSAWLAAYGLFRTCSPAGIEAAKQQALADAPNHIVVMGATAVTAAPPAAAAPQTSAAAPASDRSAGVPLVIVHTPLPAAVAQAVPDAQIRKMQDEWLAIQRRGRNAAEGGPQSLPPIPRNELALPKAPDPAPETSAPIPVPREDPPQPAAAPLPSRRKL